MPCTLLVNFMPVFDNRHFVFQGLQGHWHFSGKRSECNDELESQKATKMCRGPVDQSKKLLNTAFTPAAYAPGFFETQIGTRICSGVTRAWVLRSKFFFSASSFVILEFLTSWVFVILFKKKPDLHAHKVCETKVTPTREKWRTNFLVNKVFTSSDRQSENMTCLDWEYSGQLARKAVGLLTFCQLQTRQIIAGKRQCDCCKKFAILFHIRHSTSRPWRVTYPKIGEILRRCCTPAADKPRSPLQSASPPQI